MLHLNFVMVKDINTDMANEVDISESKLFLEQPAVLKRLLRCHSRFALYREHHPKDFKGHEDECHIIWATADYAKMGKGFRFQDQIEEKNITGQNGLIIRPRAIKSTEEQSQRSKNMAEVFTPTWVCNAQNNLIDNAWFGREGVFNEEYIENGEHKWKPSKGNIVFDNDNAERSWKAYVREQRLEMACGEAPYLVSRYDVVNYTDQLIPVEMRIGLLDRKLRVVSENVDEPTQWMDWAEQALKATYGFEWQGDNLLLAREAVLMTVCDYFEAKFGEPISADKKRKARLNYLAYIISWNLWQMDGLKMVIPCSCKATRVVANQKDIDGAKAQIEAQKMSLFPMNIEIPKPQFEMRPCEGCQSGDYSKHTGILCRVRDWTYEGKDYDKQRPYFYTLFNNN